MQLLVILTLAYVAILVLALAASLIAILIYLRRISAALADAKSALVEVRDTTGNLAQPIHRLDEAIVGSSEALDEADTRLARATEQLVRLAERMGVIELSR